MSYGGGVQSTALLVLAAQGVIDFDLFLMADVGADSEHPDTIRYVAEVAKPYAAAHGIELRELQRVPVKGKFAGQVETLWGRLMHPESRSLPIPVRMSNGAPGTRSCTADFKIRVIAKELKRLGATKEEPAIVALGISVDEIERAKPGIDPQSPIQQRVYPLLDLGLHRSDCVKIILEAGLPQPGKSACFFCPFHRPHVWGDMARDEPDLFEKACDLEDTLNRRRADLGKDSVYLTRFGRPLRRVIADAGTQLPLALYEQDEGYRCGDVCDT